MKRENFVFYRSYWEQAKEMNKNDRLKFLEAICELALDGNEIELKGTPKIAFIGVKPQVVANNKKYVNGTKGGVHGNKGGRPKKQNDGDENKNPYGVNDETPNVNDNDNVNDNEECINVNENVFGLFETEFKRPLSSNELIKLSDWIEKYGEENVTFALRSAIVQGVTDFNYINRILEIQSADEESF